jgi:hypothetical protein
VESRQTKFDSVALIFFATPIAGVVPAPLHYSRSEYKRQ